MPMWLSDEEDEQDRRPDDFTFPLPALVSRSDHKHDIGLHLLDTSRLRIDRSHARELIHQLCLSRAMVAIHASVQRIGRTDKLIGHIWTGKP